MGGANPTGPALDQQHREREEQVKVLEAGVCQGGLVVLARTVARDQAMGQQHLCGLQAELADPSGVPITGSQSLFHQEH